MQIPQYTLPNLASWDMGVWAWCETRSALRRGFGGGRVAAAEAHAGQCLRRVAMYVADHHTQVRHTGFEGLYSAGSGSIRGGRDGRSGGLG